MSIRFHHPAVCAACFLPLVASADESSPSLVGSVLQLIFGFGLIVALLFAMLWALKKLSTPHGAAGGMVRVVSAAAVGPRERVVLVDVGEKRLVLGVAPGHVSLLDTQPAPIEAPPLAARVQPAMPAFADWLKHTLGKRNDK